MEVHRSKTQQRTKPSLIKLFPLFSLQLKPELMPIDVSHLGRKMKGVVSWDRSKDEPVEKEVSVKQPSTEPTRIKIFEGG